MNAGAGSRPIFQEEWWCEAACPGGWLRASYQQEGSVQASVILWPRRLFGQRSLEMPYYARAMEPSFVSNIAPSEVTYRHRVKALSHLIAEFPRYDRFSYTLPPGSPWSLPFNLLGFSTELEYTFRHAPNRDPDPWRSMNSKMRNKIRLGENRLHIEEHVNFERFSALARPFLKSKGRITELDYPALTRTFKACADRGQGAIITAVDDQGVDVAASVLLWDDAQLYYWLSVRDVERSKNYGNGYLVWTALKMAIAKGLEFDVDGFASPEQGRFLTMFGLTPVQRTKVSGQNTAFSVISTIRQIARGGQREKAPTV